MAQDWRCQDPFTGTSAAFVKVAARIKEGRLTPASMNGREGDHNAGWGGWARIRWGLLQTRILGTDPCRG